VTDTSIEWCRRPGTRAKTWNPTNGCKEISPGCLHCYAKVFASRFCGPGLRYEGLVEKRGKNNLPMWTGELRFEPHMLGAPLSWRDPCTVFVNSMSDLFMFPPEVIAAVLGVAAACRNHTFIFLTKRAEAMPRWFEWLDDSVEGAAQEWSGRDCATSIFEARDGERVLMLLEHAARVLGGDSKDERDRWFARLFDRLGDKMVWPLPNVWLGVTCEDRKHGLPRLDFLRSIEAAVRLVSFEPLLEDLGNVDLTGIDWSIVGCESGHGARPCDVEWIRRLRGQSRRAGAAFFVKQATEASEVVYRGTALGRRPVVTAGEGSKLKGGGVIGAPYLDGQQYLEFPTPRAS